MDVCVCSYMYACTNTSVLLYMCIDVNVYIYICIHTYIYIYIYMCVCVYVSIQSRWRERLVVHHTTAKNRISVSRWLPGVRRGNKCALPVGVSCVSRTVFTIGRSDPLRYLLDALYRRGRHKRCRHAEHTS